MFCRNCGSQIPDDTKFCNNCGAAQENAPVQSAPSVQPAAPAPQPAVQPAAPAPTAAPKKNPMMLVIVAAVAVVAIVFGMFVIAPAMSGNKDQAPGGETSVVADGKNDQTSANNDENQEENQEKPSTEKPVSKALTFKYKTPDDNDYSRFELFYRDGSEYVSRVQGTIRVAKGSDVYEDAVARNTAFEEKVKATGLPEEIMWFYPDVINLTDGYAVSSFTFAELDGNNASSVEMVAEYIGFPTSGGYLKLSDCKEFLLENGFVEN